MSNRKTRRAEKPNGNDPLLEAAMRSQPMSAPVVLELNACRIHVEDVQTSEGAQKMLSFVHLTGGFVARCSMPTKMAREVATMLTTPPGIVVPTGTEDA